MAGRTGFQENSADRYTIIQISDKVCDSVERLRGTLIHEMCHAACWLIDGEYTHGLLWQYYCDKAPETLPELPEITVHHNWEIHYTVIYHCSGCHARLGRWTQSVDTEKSVEDGSCKLLRRSVTSRSIILQNIGPENAAAHGRSRPEDLWK